MQIFWEIHALVWGTLANFSSLRMQIMHEARCDFSKLLRIYAYLSDRTSSFLPEKTIIFFFSRTSSNGRPKK